jgi:hypothetical protein
MGTLEGRRELTWFYLPPGWEPQRAVGMSSEPPPKPRCRVHRRGHGKPCTGCQGERRVGWGRPWLNPPKPEPEQSPKWEAPPWGKAPSREENLAYARWRIGGSTRGSDVPPEERGRAAYRGKRRSREAIAVGRLTGCESGGMHLEKPAKDEPIEALPA